MKKNNWLWQYAWSRLALAAALTLLLGSANWVVAAHSPLFQQQAEATAQTFTTGVQTPGQDVATPVKGDNPDGNGSRHYTDPWIIPEICGQFETNPHWDPYCEFFTDPEMTPYCGPQWTYPEQDPACATYPAYDPTCAPTDPAYDINCITDPAWDPNCGTATNPAHDPTCETDPAWDPTCGQYTDPGWTPDCFTDPEFWSECVTDPAWDPTCGQYTDPGWTPDCFTDPEFWSVCVSDPAWDPNCGQYTDPGWIPDCYTDPEFWSECVTDPVWMPECYLTNPQWWDECVTDPIWMPDCFTDPEWVPECFTDPVWMPECYPTNPQWWDICITDPNWDPGCLTPVNLQSFEARWDNHCIVLEWQSALESDLAYYIVSRRDAGNPEFAQLETQSTQGDPNAPTHAYSFIDRAVLPASDYDYRLEAISLSGDVSESRVITISTPANHQQNLPDGISVYRSYPNPANPITHIEFALTGDISGHLQLAVYNVAGKLVSTLASEPAHAGYYNYTWDGSDAAASGIYFAVLRVGDSVTTMKLMLVK